MIQQNNGSEYGQPEFKFVPSASLLSCVRLRSGQVKLFNLRVRLNLWQNAYSIPQHRPKQHVVCLHHFHRPMTRNGSCRSVTSFSSPAIWQSSHYRMGSVVRSTSYQHFRHQTLSCTRSPLLLHLRRESWTRQQISLLRPCSTRRVREFCATTRKSGIGFAVHHDSPTINCVQRSITSMTISENLSSCVRFLELLA